MERPLCKHFTKSCKNKTKENVKGGNRHYSVNQRWYENLQRDNVGVRENVFLNPDEYNSGVKTQLFIKAEFVQHI